MTSTLLGCNLWPSLDFLRRLSVGKVVEALLNDIGITDWLLEREFDWYSFCFKNSEWIKDQMLYIFNLQSRRKDWAKFIFYFMFETSVKI